MVSDGAGWFGSALRVGSEGRLQLRNHNVSTASNRYLLAEIMVDTGGHTACPLPSPAVEIQRTGNISILESNFFFWR